MAPRDEAMLVHMLRTALATTTARSRCATRAARASASPLPRRAAQAIEIGTGEILREGDAASRSLGYGSGVGKALEAADLLAERGIDVTVADARFAKPIDAGLMAQLAAEHDLLVTVEEGVLAGGFGSAVLGDAHRRGGRLPRILRVGLPDRYVTHGKPALLHEEVGFTGERIAERIAAAVGSTTSSRRPERPARESPEGGPCADRSSSPSACWPAPRSRPPPVPRSASPGGSRTS